MSHEVAQTVQSSIADVWYLKEIHFSGRKHRIITQNFNGPCSFIAICNILILRGNIEVLPPTRRTVSYEFLSHLVADYLLKTSPDVDVSSALSVMPLTQKGMDLNPVFTSPTAFRPSGSVEGGGELKLFEHVGIPLVHGWLVDPDSPDSEVLNRISDYDFAVELIAEVDHLTNGKFVVSEDNAIPMGTSPGSPTSPTRNWTEEDIRKMEDAIVIRRFLDATQSQLSYHGLFKLATSLPPNTLCALFRNSHLSVLYKHAPSLLPHTPSPAPSNPLAPTNPEYVPTPDTNSAEPSTKGETAPPVESDDNAALYSLVTDQVFLREPFVVWERFEDVDGGWSTFVDSDFVKSSPAGGDFAGQTAEEALKVAEAQAAGHDHAHVDANDLALARQLQAEEEYLARREHEAYRREQHRRRQIALQQHQQEQQEQLQQQESRKKEKKKGDCIIM